METKFWGRAFWTSMFSVALTYPRKPQEREILHYKQYYVGLQHILPCYVCKKKYAIKLRKYEIDSSLKSGRKELFKWVLKMHNLVAKDLGKKELDRVGVFNKFFPGMKKSNVSCKCNNPINGGMLILPVSLLLTVGTMLFTRN